MPGGPAPDPAASRNTGTAGAAETPEAPAQGFVPPERFSYRIKRALLGPPLVSERLAVERLGRPTALAILSSDVMSSSAYATEEILIVLVIAVGIGAYKLVIPVTVAVCLVLMFVTMSYLQVIRAFPRAGGAYMVSRDTFGHNVAQVASASLLIDYTLTVAVSIAAGVDALVTEVPALAGSFHHVPYPVLLSVGFVLAMAYGNLRGIREAGRTFALPTFFFIANMVTLIVVGIIRWIAGNLPVMDVNAQVHDTKSPVFPVPPAIHGGGLLIGASLFVMAKAFANGGTAVTGTEAISNGVSVFRLTHRSRHGVVTGESAQSANARTTLIAMALILGSMFAGLSVLASHIHPVPRVSGTPTVIGLIGKDVYGSSLTGHILSGSLQLGTFFILTLAANTSFSGFPLLASFAAEDAFLPRQLTRRGHRLVFSNGIIILTFFSVVLLVLTRANVTSLIALYAIGVYTGFTMAGAGMVKHHWRLREQGWRHRIVINGFAAVLCAFVDLVFMVTKFTEGAWVVVVLMPLMVFAFIRLHKQYDGEATVLERDAPGVCEAPILRRHVVIVLVERLDLATARAIRYARTLTPDDLRAVHIVEDADEARELEEGWRRLGLSRLPLDLVECADRRLGRAVAELVADAASDSETEVSVLLPRHVYVGAWRRLLHDRTAERIAAVVSPIPNASATIIPFHVPHGDGSGRAFATAARGDADAGDRAGAQRREPAAAVDLSVPSVSGHTPIRDLVVRRRARIAGRVVAVRVQPRAGAPNLECALADHTGQVTLVFQGRRSVPGIDPGAHLVAEGTVGTRGSKLVILNPAYEIRRSPGVVGG